MMLYDMMFFRHTLAASVDVLPRLISTDLRRDDVSARWRHIRHVFAYFAFQR